MLRNRFGILLAFLILLLILPIALRSLDVEWDRTLAPATMSLALVAMLVAALLAIREDRPTIIIAGAAIILAAILRAIELTGGYRWGLVGYQIIILLITTYVIGVTVRFLFTSPQVNGNMIAAAISAYLLVGIVWALAYSLADAIEPGSFRSATLGSGIPFMQVGTEHSFHPFYYSLVTLTTLGYGDIVPVSRTASMLAVMEAMTGQIYLAVLVARLVGLHVAQSRDHGAP